MSDGLRRLAGSPMPATIDGKTYTLEPATLAMLAEIESHLVGVRPNVLVETLKVLDQAPEAMRVRMVQMAIDKRQTAKGRRVERRRVQHVPGLAHRHFAPVLVDGSKEPSRAGEAGRRRHRQRAAGGDQGGHRPGKRDDLPKKLRWPDRGGSGSGDEVTRTPWAPLYRHFASECGWLPSRVTKLTLYQALVLYGGPIDARTLAE